MTRRILLAAVLGATAWAPACGPTQDVQWEIRDLELPSDEQAQAGLDLREARRLVLTGEDVAAEGLLRGVLGSVPASVEANALLGRVLVATRRRAAAVPFFRRVVELDPDNFDVHQRLAEVLFELGRLGEAEEAHLGWMRANRRSSEAPFGLGKVRYARGDFEGAMKALRQAEQIRRARADIRSELGLVLHAQGKLDKAERKQRDALERDPGMALAWFRLGAVISAGEDPLARLDEALDAFGNAVRLKPKLANAHLYLYRLRRLAAAAGGEGQADLAEKSFRALLSYHRKEALAGFGLGQRPSKVPDPEEREKVLRAAVETSAGDPSPPLLALGRFLHGDRRFTEALDLYTQVLGLFPEHAEARALSGGVRVQLGDLEGAEVDLREAVRLDPDLENAWRSLAWAMLNSRRDREAVEAYDQVLRLHPDDPRARKGRGLARMHAGQLDQGFHEIADAGWIER